jgi:uncharacterized protein YjaG (DUF416 family)
MTSNTFNSFKFQRVDSNSTLTCEISIDTCQKIVDEFIAFMRGCGFMDVNIYTAMENAVEEHTSYQAHLEKDKVHLEKFEKAAYAVGLYEPIGK